MNFERICITQKNYILKFEKKIGKLPIFWQHDFSKYHILCASLRAHVPCLQEIQKSYMFPQKNFKIKIFFCHKSAVKLTKNFLPAIENFLIFSKKNTKKSRFFTLFFFENPIVPIPGLSTVRIWSERYHMVGR